MREMVTSSLNATPKLPGAQQHNVNISLHEMHDILLRDLFPRLIHASNLMQTHPDAPTGQFAMLALAYDTLQSASRQLDTTQSFVPNLNDPILATQYAHLYHLHHLHPSS